MGMVTVTEYYVSCDGPNCDNADGSSRATKGTAAECARQQGFIRRRTGEWLCPECASEPTGGTDGPPANPQPPRP